MKEIRLHGRGGQGVAMASEMLAATFVSEGKYATAFPMFGVERRGAPVAAFVRFDERPVTLRTQVYTPDALLIADPFLESSPMVFQGLRPAAVLVVNSAGDATERLHPSVGILGLVDATSIAIEEMGRPVTNTCMLGAFARVTGWLSLESLLSSLELYFDGALLEKNLMAARRGYAETRLMRH